MQLVVRPQARKAEEARLSLLRRPQGANQVCRQVVGRGNLGLVALMPGGDLTDDGGKG